jgi:hypothetical protein
MFEGRILGVLPADGATADTVGMMMAGREVQASGERDALG